MWVLNDIYDGNVTFADFFKKNPFPKGLISMLEFFMLY